LLLAGEEADRLSSRRICTEHLLLGLLRCDGSLAAQLLQERGLQLALLRQELRGVSHDDSKLETFIRESERLPEGVLEQRTRLESIMSRMRDSIARHDFEKARCCADEELAVRDTLRSLYQQVGLSGWIFE
jgi:ATP-dependent Clp protease ATP-binding subunit ClpA